MSPSQLNLGSALAYAAGAVFMKLSLGFTRLTPTLGVYVAFGLGASLQILAMQRQDIGVSYTLVLGLEAVAAFILGVLLFKEPVTLPRVAAVILVAMGVYLLRK